MFKSQSTVHMREKTVVRIPIDMIDVNPHQPRQTLTPESVQQMAESIRRHGQLTPILVRRRGERYELIAGQRRLEAVRFLERPGVEAVVLSAGDCDSALIALVENVQREALHFLDEAEACRRMLDAYPITQERLAACLSLSPSALNNRLRLLKLPEQVREAVRTLGLTERHARALIRLPDAGDQLRLARQAASTRMTVRQLENAVDQLLRPRPPRPTISPRVRDNRIIINAVMDTVRELNHIGVAVKSRVEECEDHIDVVVTIPVRQAQHQSSE